MPASDSVSIACTLGPGDYKARRSSIAELTHDALRRHTRHDLELQLVYANSAATRLREIVRAERTCCAFLTFNLEEGEDELRLTIVAPERARGATDELFGAFLPSTKTRTGCGYC